VDTSSFAYVAIGTNNSAGTVTAAAGKALAKAARKGTDYAASHGWDQAAVIGANDFESFSGSSATQATAWIDGYNSYSNPMFFVNYGSADGCPNTHVPSSTDCNAPLHASTIYHLSWSGVAYPLPEIYRTDSYQAQQWKYLSLFAYQNHGAAFTFQGVMTQHGACQSASCVGTDNTASQGWTQLNTQLNSNTHTATTPGAPTDIRGM
jgi:hypothetical protein